ncbi:MAG: DUF2207 domain-containing protein [Candidatus Omnitrophica bacterium]|nr:DUF2207 domain-containing protein [Candidatus Omnitrophota bacterium]
MRSRVWWIGWLLAAASSPAAHAWEIASFETQVLVHEDATATVMETILANFTGESRHGIYRDIPVHYTDRIGQHFRLRLRVREVTDRNGQPWRYRLEAAGRYRRIRIGDPDATVTGLQTYRLVYEVQRGAIRFFPDPDECYWNLTGHEWAVPMRRVRAELVLPPAVRDVRSLAFLGGYGSTDRLREEELHRFGERVVFEPARALQPYEGLTAAVAWSRGVVHPPSGRQVLGWWLQDNWVYGIPLVVLAAMGWLWNTRGRDPKPPRSQVVQYEPPDGLSPAEVGALMDQQANLRDLTSTIIDLAVRGSLRIEPVTSPQLSLIAPLFSGGVSDYRLVSLKSEPECARLKPHEQAFLQHLFGAGWKAGDIVKLSDLKHEFYEHLPGLSEQVYLSLIGAGYLEGNPQKVRLVYTLGGAAAGILLWGGLLGAQPWHQLPTVPVLVAAVLSAMSIILIGLAMPRRTLKGSEVTGRIFGFLEFLRRTDQDRIRRLNDPSLFERCLPYAVAFGVAHHWAKAFEGLVTQPPSWYAGTWDTFSPSRLGADLHQATASMSRVFSSPPSSSSSGFSGGGSSGGGGGGGGGGAW